MENVRGLQICANLTKGDFSGGDFVRDSKLRIYNIDLY